MNTNKKLSVSKAAESKRKEWPYMNKLSGGPSVRTRVVARVRLVDDDPRARLTLKTVLEAGGYQVRTAASAAEASQLLRREEFELVLSDLHMESQDAGLNVLAQARAQHYRPATAILDNDYFDHSEEGRDSDPDVLIGTMDLPEFFGKITQLISRRATRAVEREMRAAARVG